MDNFIFSFLIGAIASFITIKIYDYIDSKKENKYEVMKNHIKALANDPKFGEKSHLGISDKEWNADAYRCGFLDAVDIIDRYMPELDIYDKDSKRRKKK